MTKFQKYTLTTTLTGLIGIPLLLWLVNFHLALASEADVAQAIGKVQIELRANRRRDLLKSNKRELRDVQYQILELEKHPSDSPSEIALLHTLRAAESELLLDQGCIIRTGRECEEDPER